MNDRPERTGAEDGDDGIDGPDEFHSSDELRGPDELDEQLSAAGRALRDSARRGDGGEVIVSVLRRRVRRSRRVAGALGAAAVVVAIALVGSVVADGERPRRVELAAATDPVAGLLASLPSEPVDPTEVELVATVSSFEGCDALIDRLRRVGAEHVGSRGFGSLELNNMLFDSGYGRVADMSSAVTPASGDAQSAGGASGSSKQSMTDGGTTLGTNVMVDGVDEPDFVKAVDHLVVDIAGTVLRVIDTSVPAIVGTLELVTLSKDVWGGPTSLLLDGRTAVVFGSETVTVPAVEDDPSATRPTLQYLTITRVDLSDPAAPTVLERVRIEGALVSARRVGDEVRIVTASSMADLPFVNPVVPNAVAPALQANRAAVARSEVADWIPVWDRGQGTDSEALLDCDRVVVPDTFAGVQMTSMVSFDMSGDFAPRALGLLAPSDRVTATADDVVIGAEVWVDPAIRYSDDLEFRDWSTALHRFAFTDGEPRYVGSGEVAGSLHNDFSLAVLGDGSLGVVTTAGDPWRFQETSEVHLGVLSAQPDDTTLTPVADLLLGTGSSVVGLRFLGDRLLVASGFVGNVITVVDLSQPQSPGVLGEVITAGSGAYFHPLGDGRVLVVGETVRVDGQYVYTGAHVSLVDLGGVPGIVASWSQEDLRAGVGYDHHGFMWWPERGLGAFGVTWTNPLVPPAALFAAVAGDELDVRSVRPQDAPLGPRCPPEQVDRRGCDNTGWPHVDRVLVVEGVPWLHTGESLEALDAGTLEPAALVPLPSTRPW